MMSEQQLLLTRVKTVLGARIKAGLLYTAMGGHAKEQQFSDGAIWALERILLQVEALNLETLIDNTGDFSANKRASFLWNTESSSCEK